MFQAAANAAQDHPFICPHPLSQAARRLRLPRGPTSKASEARLRRAERGGRGGVRAAASRTPDKITSGAERDRTVGLLNAIEALSQLSYSPSTGWRRQACN
jgi:hypothetical protein